MKHHLSGWPKIFAALLTGVAVSAGLLAGQACRRVPQQRYELKGKVVSVDRQQRRVTIAHEEVPGLMEAMTMPFTLKDERALDVMAPGDRIQATLVVDGSRSWLENPVITRESADSAGSSSDRGKANAPEPQPGDEVPDFTLVNQDGKRLRLQQYRGRALLVTFIYTRCPLPDQCPLMSAHFAEVNKALKSDPALSGNTHLLSITLDPAYDTPQVLRNYASKYVGDDAQAAFKRWEFATGTAPEVKAVAQFFGLSYWLEKDQIVHSLRTAVIAPDGKLFKLYRGNEWKPAEILSDLRQLSPTAPPPAASGS